MIYAFEVTDTIIVNFSLEPTASSLAAFGLDDDCPPLPGCYVPESMYGSPLHIGCRELLPGTYFVQVDNWPPPDCVGEFTLSEEVFTPLDTTECNLAEGCLEYDDWDGEGYYSLISSSPWEMTAGTYYVRVRASGWSSGTGYYKLMITVE